MPANSGAPALTAAGASLRRQIFANRCLFILLLFLVAGTARTVVAAPLRVAVISDLNGSYGTIGYRDGVADAVSRIIELHPDLVISTGDMIAGQSRTGLSAERLRAMWRAFHETVTEPLSAAGIPLAITPGNHDASAYTPFVNERALFDEEWRDRATDLNFIDRGGYPFDYAFELGDALFISLDVTTTGKLAARSFEWLDRLLERESGSFRYVVAFSHVPVWPVAAGRSDEATMDTRLHSRLVDAGVDLYLSGHHHAFYPGVVDGIAYVSQPCLGSGARHVIGSSSGDRFRGFTFIQLGDTAAQVAALAAPGFREQISWQMLPGRIELPEVLMLRADIGGSDIEPFPAEFRW